MAQSQAFPTAIGRPSTIHGQRVSIHEPTLFGIGEKSNGTGNIIRRCESSHRHTACDISIGIKSAGLGGVIHIGLHPSRTDRVTSHATPSPLSSKSAGQPYQSMFGSVISRTVCHTDQPSNGRNIHNASTSLL